MGCDCLQKLDLFAAPFTFLFSKPSNKNQTKLGGLITIILIILCLIYGIYLAIIFFSKQMPSNISSFKEDKIIKNFPMEYSPLAITVLSSKLV